jgi:glycine oxidase ThiO
MSRLENDLIIIGRGVIGYSIAFRLKQIDPDLKITVLGDPMNSLMASRAAAGMLAPFSECEKDDRFLQFCRESLDKYPKFVEAVISVSEGEIYFSKAGAIMPFCLVGDQWEQRLQFFKEASVPHEVWSVAEVRRKLPYLSSDCGEVIWVGEGLVNSRQLHDALAIAIDKLGVEIIDQNVTGFIHNSDSISEIVTDSGTASGKRFVLATGSWSTQLASVLGISIPMRPIKGQMCRLQVEDDRLGYTVHGFLTYIVPWRGGQGFVLGTTMEDRGFDPVVEEKAIQDLIERSSAVLPCLRDSPLIETWTGLRPAPEDEMPIMGRSARYENLYYSTGHFRNGILQAPNQADYLAAVILGMTQEDIPEFSPSRYNL